MRLAWATDLHLNFVDLEAAARFCEAVIAVEADRLVITGDIGEAHDVGRFLGFLADRIDRPIDFVLGNHDFYGGSIAEVRAAMAEVTRSVPPLNWLPASGVVPLTDEVALIGHDGWGDGRLGDFARSNVRLNDYRLIVELAGLSTDRLRRRLHALGDEAAEYASRVLPLAFERHRAAIFATHVPPFRAASMFKGRISDDNWAPHFTCGALGDALSAIMEGHPDRRLLVLCGHVHHQAEVRVLPNLSVLTGAAEYRRPELQRVFRLPDDLDALFDPSTPSA